MHSEFLDCKNIFSPKIKQHLFLRFLDQDFLIIPIFTAPKQNDLQWPFSIFSRVGKYFADISRN